MIAASAAGTTTLSYIFCQLQSSRALCPFKHKCQAQPQVKMSATALYCPAARKGATGSLTKSIDFPETNYPGVRDLTHKFRAAVGFSDFNHTSMLAPRSNLHCLSRAPALCQLCIDCYPALALCCDSSLSVPILRLSPPTLSLVMAGEKQPEGTRAAENRKQER